MCLAMGSAFMKCSVRSMSVFPSARPRRIISNRSGLLWVGCVTGVSLRLWPLILMAPMPSVIRWHGHRATHKPAIFSSSYLDGPRLTIQDSLAF